MDKSSFAYINIALVKNKAVFLRNPQLFYENKPSLYF
jgi:hypothetical protein